jgi:hypothetical protein
LIGKAAAYLILALGIAGTFYLFLRGFGSGPVSWLPLAFLAAGTAASIALALALRALTVALEFGLFTVGWFLFLQALPAFAPFPSLSSVAGASTWMALSIVTTTGVERIGKRATLSRGGGTVVAGAASALRMVKR